MKFLNEEVRFTSSVFHEEFIDELVDYLTKLKDQEDKEEALQKNYENYQYPK